MVLDRYIRTFTETDKFIQNIVIKQNLLVKINANAWKIFIKPSHEKSVLAKQ